MHLVWIVLTRKAFGQLGYNVTAHNLALGILLAWLPTLVLCSIVDRNPVQADATRNKLNKLVGAVRGALLDPDLRETYIRDTGRPEKDFSWTQKLSDGDYFRDDFFTRFAGQGRVRWHYGFAHGILTGIEESFVAEQGRGWFTDDKVEAARTSLVKGPPEIRGLGSFDSREAWQIIGSFIIVSFSVLGAFIISFFTPTVGLGCRSGGYMIFIMFATGIFTIEMVSWQFVPEGSIWDSNRITQFNSNMERQISQIGLRPLYFGVSKAIWWWKNLSARDRLEVMILRPLECFNTIWLMYIVTAQTFGSYRTCDCQCSTWGTGGGYMDFETQSYYLSRGIGITWGVGTGLAGSSMFVAFIYVVTEWCLQSHLVTENYESARKGLLLTRRFKKYTTFGRKLLELVRDFLDDAFQKIFVQRINRRRRSKVRWSAYSRNGMPTQRNTPRDSYECAIEEELLPSGQDHGQQNLGYELMSPPSPSYSRSSRSSFGRYDGENEMARPRDFA
jgi:hypothetical protein